MSDSSVSNDKTNQATTPALQAESASAGPEWLRPFVARAEAGTLPRRSDEPEPTVLPPYRSTRYPADWPDSFLRLCDELRLAQYRDDLADVMAKRLPDNDLFRDFRMAWAARGEIRVSAVLSGSKGAGKSVCALWACMQACRDHNSGFEFLDLGEFADLWALQDRDRIYAAKRAGLLVVDEVDDVADVKGPAFALFKRVVNARYRNKQPSILCTNMNLTDLRTAIGQPLVDRFPLHLGSDSESFRV